MRKIFTIVSRIPSAKIDRGMLEMKDLAQLDQRRSRLLEGANLLVQDGMYSLVDIEAEVFATKAKGNLGLVVIDCLQLIDKPLTYAASDRTSEIAAISRSIRKLSKATRIPILLLSSVNSAVDLREFNKRPLITDLDAPGAISDDCDMLWMLYRDELYDKNEDNPNIGTVDLAILKNRRGKLNLIEMRFIEEYHRFEDIVNF